MLLPFYKRNFYFYSLVAILLLLIVFSNPFLRYPYDMFHHLITIDEIYTQIAYPVKKSLGIWADNIYFMVPREETYPIILEQPRHLWHYIWAKIFHLLHIDNSQLFLRAKVIHVTQTLISILSIYYFSNVLIRNTYKPISPINLQWLSFWSVLIWLTIFATFSVAYHQVWIMWYSVNYQISLPLFWYMLGLTIVLILEQNTWKAKLFFMLLLLLITRFIIQIHSMEFMYYLMHILVFFLIFIDKIFLIFKKYFYILLPFILGIIYIAKDYRPAQSPLFKYLSIEQLPELYDKILYKGSKLVNGVNRASHSVNELMYFIGLLGTFYLLYLLYLRYIGKTAPLNYRILIYISLTSLFLLIPLYQFSAGLFAIITYSNVVNRLYYSSSLFIVLPIVIYGLLVNYKIRMLYINIIIFILLISVAIFSKHNSTLHHNYYKNLQSLKNSFYKAKVGFNLSEEHIHEIGKKLKRYELEQPRKKKIYYARADIAFVLKYIYKKNVYWEGRRAHPDFIKIYESNKHNHNFEHVLFEVPSSIPLYKPYR